MWSDILRPVATLRARLHRAPSASRARRAATASADIDGAAPRRGGSLLSPGRRACLY
jgi:hypothetical protein